MFKWKLRLLIKVYSLKLLRGMGVIPNIWYQSEIDLAWDKAKEMSGYFSGKDNE